MGLRNIYITCLILLNLISSSIVIATEQKDPCLLPAFTNLTSLTRLDIMEDKNITDAVLLCLPNLTSLNLGKNENITDDSISQLTNLTSLYLENNNITENSILHLKNLQTLDLGVNKNITDDFLISIGFIKEKNRWIYSPFVTIELGLFTSIEFQDEVRGRVPSDYNKCHGVNEIFKVCPLVPYLYSWQFNAATKMMEFYELLGRVGVKANPLLASLTLSVEYIKPKRLSIPYIFFSGNEKEVTKKVFLSETEAIVAAQNLPIFLKKELSKIQNSSIESMVKQYFKEICFSEITYKKPMFIFYDDNKSSTINYDFSVLKFREFIYSHFIELPEDFTSEGCNLHLMLENNLPKTLSIHTPAIVKLADGQYNLIVKREGGVKHFELPEMQKTFESIFQEYAPKGKVLKSWSDPIIQDIAPLIGGCDLLEYIQFLKENELLINFTSIVKNLAHYNDGCSNEESKNAKLGDTNKLLMELALKESYLRVRKWDQLSYVFGEEKIDYLFGQGTHPEKEEDKSIKGISYCFHQSEQAFLRYLLDKIDGDNNYRNHFTSLFVDFIKKYILENFETFSSFLKPRGIVQEATVDARDYLPTLNEIETQASIKHASLSREFELEVNSSILVNLDIISPRHICKYCRGTFYFCKEKIRVMLKDIFTGGIVINKNGKFNSIYTNIIKLFNVNKNTNSIKIYFQGDVNLDILATSKIILDNNLMGVI